MFSIEESVYHRNSLEVLYTKRHGFLCRFAVCFQSDLEEVQIHRKIVDPGHGFVVARVCPYDKERLADEQRRVLERFEANIPCN